MDFEEFEKKFEEKSNYFIFIEGSGVGITIYDDQSKYPYEIISCCDEYSRYCYTIGKYNTLKEAYEALKEICELNGVEMV